MGRNIAGLCVTSMDPNNVSDDDVKAKVAEAKDHRLKEGAAETSPVKNSQQKQDMLGVKSSNPGAEKHDIESAKAEDQRSNSPEKRLATFEKHFMKPAKAENQNSNSTEKAVPDRNGQSKLTAQKALDSECDKSAYVRPVAAETPMSDDKSSTEAHNFQSPISAKKPQPNSPFWSRKHVDDEDNYSLASSAASAMTTRSRTTVAVAPTFKIHERLEKRKEFYTKLEMKQKALEAEKREYVERTKEEEAAAIRQLRKNMVVKAHEVPSFYYKGPPPKKELKKLPTTRAVSPKLGRSRRKSCGDAVGSSTEEKVTCTRALRHSVGSYRDTSTPASAPKTKTRLSDRNGNIGGKYKDRLKQVKEPKSAPPKLTAQKTADIAVQS